MDLISKKQAIDTINKYLHENAVERLTGFDITSLLLEIPIIESRSEGKWIDTGQIYSDGRQYCECSICGSKNLRPVGYYCRWCGAKMRGGE